MHDNDTPNDNLIPYGYCHCGCGEKTQLAIHNDRARGRVKGEPYRFKRGHNTRTPDSLFRQSYGKRQVGYRRRPKNKPPKWDSEMKCFMVPLTKGQYALVDEQDLHIVKGFSWQALRARYGWYARRGGGSAPTVLMHRAIVNPPSDMVVHHVNGNGLDNRRSNLEVITLEENTSRPVNKHR